MSSTLADNQIHVYEPFKTANPENNELCTPDSGKKKSDHLYNISLGKSYIS